MKKNPLFAAVLPVLLLAPMLSAQATDSCAALAKINIPTVEIVKTTSIFSAPEAPSPYGIPGYTGMLPDYCRVDGTINRRTGVEGKEFGIGFALALPDNWNGDFLMQGGGGSNGVILPPLGATAAGDTPGLVRGFAVVSTDTGHKSKNGSFDFDFMRDQQAMLDFAYLANAEVATVAKQIIARYYAKPAAYAYFIGCSTGGREGMILSQRYPSVFNGIVSGDPAMRTGFSNLAIGGWIPVAFNQIAPKDTAGKPLIEQAITDADRKLVIDALLRQCDARDGVADGMIFDPLGCNFDPSMLACKNGESGHCLSPAKVEAIQKVFGGTKDSRGVQVYPGFLYDTGIGASFPIPGILKPGKGVFGPPTTATTFDVDKAAMNALDPLVEPASTHLTTFSLNGGKLIFYHGDSDPWFSPLDTLGYYKSMAEANGGIKNVADWSRIYLVPGMGHCGGGPATLDHFDMLTAIVNWVEKKTPPGSVTATGSTFPGRSRPLCAYPKHTQYKGTGDSEKAENFTCVE
jgi:hypothetical protein